MSLAIDRIGKYLTKTYEGKIDLSDVAQFGEQQQQKDLLSRSLAAHILSRLCRISPDVAANSVCDGFDDLGIDAFHYDRQAKIAYVVQSKWSKTGSKRINITEATKVITGFRKILDIDIATGNDRIRRFEKDFDDAANDADTRFSIVFCTTADACFEDNAKQYVNTEVDKIAGLSGLVMVREFNRDKLYETLTSATEPEKISMTINVEEWSQIAEPIPAVTGRVSLANILEWSRFGVGWEALCLPCGRQAC